MGRAAVNSQRRCRMDGASVGRFLEAITSKKAVEFSDAWLRILNRGTLFLSAAAVSFLFVLQIAVAIRAGYFTPFSLLEESAYTFISANNFLNFGFFNSGLLQDFATSLHPADHPYVYNHMPAGPDLTNALLLWITGGSYSWTRLIFAVSAIAGFAVYVRFGQLLLSRFGLQGSGLLLLFIGGWILIQMMERQIYSPLALLAFLPMYLYVRFLRNENGWLFGAALAVILLSSLYLEYSALAGIAACWGMFFVTQLLPMRFKHILLIACAFATGIVLHLVQNMIYLGWPTFVTELTYTLSNRTTGFPTQAELTAFYRSIGVVHHGSRPVEPGVLLAQIEANLTFVGRNEMLAAIAVCVVAMAGAVFLRRGREDTMPRIGEGKADLSFFLRLALWVVGTVLIPIAIFPAFAQEVTLRGSGASLFFLAIAFAAIAAYCSRALFSLGYVMAQIVVAPGDAGGRPHRMSMDVGPALSRLGGMLCLYLGVVGLGLCLAVVAAKYARNWQTDLGAIYAHGRNARMWEPLNVIRGFQGQLFMTNINIPTVGFLANAPGYGVCNPEAIGKEGIIDVSHCKSALMRRHAYWAKQRPALFYYFDDPRLFPGFADCVPAKTLVGTERRGPACMTDLLDRLIAQYHLVDANSFVRVFDLNHPRN